MFDSLKAAHVLISSLIGNVNNVTQSKIPIEKIYVGQNILGNITDLLINFQHLGKKISIISDDNTYKLAAKKIGDLLNTKKVTTIILPNKVLPTLEVVNMLLPRIQSCDSIIAVGSGTINDICKYISYLTNKPYIIFATAPSMNGYCSPNASIIINDSKRSLEAQLPKIAIFDLDILSKAPLRLIQSGIGDSLCRATCQTDWLMSHLLFDTYYNELPFKWLKDLEIMLWNNTSCIINREARFIEALTLILILSGIGMYFSHGSYPASQGEHLIAHLLDNKYHNQNYHGEQIAVTTAFMAELQQFILERNSIKIYPDCLVKQKLIDYFGPDLGIKYFNEIEYKLLSEKQAKKLQKKFSNHWVEIKSQLNNNCIDSQKLKKILSDAKLASDYKSIGWKRSDYVEAILYGAFTRNRITFLDLARYSKCLKNFIEAIK